MKNNSFALGFDVGGTRIKAAVVDHTGNLTSQLIEKSRVAEPYPAIRDQLVKMVGVLSDTAPRKPEIVGVGLAGLLDRSRRKVMAAPNCPGVVGVPLAEDLEQLLQLPVTLENDANTMALGEGAAGAAKGVNHFIAVTLGTGVGGAVIAEGKILRGWQGGGGEIGHICIDRNGPRCGCGSNGCLESFIGLKGINRWIARHAPRLRNLGMGRLSELALEGDSEAVAVFEWVGHTLGVAMAGMVNIFNPEAIVVGGGVSIAGPMLFDPMRDEIQSRAFSVYLGGIKILPAMLGNWAGVTGAGMMER
jgi:glucokinase